MATVAVSLPNTKRRPRNQPVVGRAPYPEIYFVKHIDNSRLQREVDCEKRRECFSLLVLGTLAFLFTMLFAWQHFECVRYGYLIQQLKQEQAEKVERNHALKVQFASLSDPQRIVTLARPELGLAHTNCPPGPFARGSARFSALQPIWASVLPSCGSGPGFPALVSVQVHTIRRPNAME